MSTQPRSKMRRVIAVMGVVAAILMFAGWRAVQPKIRTATMDEIRAVLPEELLAVPPVDAEAQARYQKVVDMIGKLDSKQLVKLVTTKKIPASQAYAASIAFWQANPHLCSNISSILAEGPLQTPPPKSDGDSQFLPMIAAKSFIKGATTSARLYTDHGEYGECTKLMLMSISLTNKIMGARGLLINYLGAVTLEAIVTRALDEFLSNAGFPIEDVRQILASYGPAPQSDEYLAAATVADFQHYALPMLPDPKVWWQSKKHVLPADTDVAGDEGNSKGKEDIYGNYDAIETSKLYGHSVMVAIANARRPFANLDMSVSKATEADAKTLPQEVDAEAPDSLGKRLDKLKYRFLMNKAHNSLGRQILAYSFMGDHAVSASCRWRAQLDATRVLFASVLYRAAHGGKLPAAYDGFLPYVGSWPQDPYNGKPLIYSAAKEKVYSVGENLIDDGGDVGFDISKALDLGVSLKR